MELAEPAIVYKESYIKAVKEFLADGPYPFMHRRYQGLSAEELEKDFETFVEKIKSYSRGENLPTGFLPETVLWLVNDTTYIGEARIRHKLNTALLNIGGHIGYDIRPSERRKGYGKKILELALIKAEELGIDKVLITCDETNEGSRKIIEANGGTFEDKRPNPEGGPDKLRFWIQL